jgi:hypothetical protein
MDELLITSSPTSQNSSTISAAKVNPMPRRSPVFQLWSFLTFNLHAEALGYLEVSAKQSEMPGPHENQRI